MRSVALGPASDSIRRAQAVDCIRTKGSFIRANAWAGTFDRFRRPTVVSGTGKSKVTMRGARKLRRVSW